MFFIAEHLHLLFAIKALDKNIVNYLLVYYTKKKKIKNLRIIYNLVIYRRGKLRQKQKNTLRSNASGPEYQPLYLIMEN